MVMIVDKRKDLTSSGKLVKEGASEVCVIDW